MKERLLDIFKWVLILLIAGVMFYVVFPKYDFKWPHTQMLRNAIGSVFGGIIVAILTSLYFLFKRRMRKWWFKEIFGQDADKDGTYHIVYAKLSLPDVCDQKGKLLRYPYTKPPRRAGSIDAGFSIENPVSSCEVRAAKYITATFGASVEGQPILTSDIDIESSESPLDRSFISLGGSASNWKTYDALGNSSNRFVTIESDEFISVETKKPVLVLDSQFDYGLILRLRPEEFPNRIWIVCAGLDEWGTSGAAWYLSKRWRKILWANWSWWNPFGFGKGTDFATIVRVRRGQDESAKSVAHFRSLEDVESATDQVEHTITPSTPTTETHTTTTSEHTSRSSSSKSISTTAEPSRSATPSNFENNTD